jgi:flagellar biosynthesis GTPase FlhF
VSAEGASTPQTVTYRGRSLEEVLPKIREELGPDAVIERQRTGLVGGVGGFFQREMIEVDARRPLPGEHGSLNVVAGDNEDAAALRAATAPPPDPDRDEGLSAPTMRRIAQQSEPFAELLADAEADAEADALQAAAARPAPGADHDWDAWAEDLAPDEEDEEDAAPAPPPAPPAPGLPAAGRHAASAYTQAGRPDAGSQLEPPPLPPQNPVSAARQLPAGPVVPSAQEPAAPEADAAPTGARQRPAAAAAHEAALADRGLSPVLAASVVGEAISHALPFAAGARGGLKKQVRQTLARRIPVQAGFGGAGRTIALVGTAGAGKTRAVAALAAAYAKGSDLPVVVLSLRPADVAAELRELLDPDGVTVRPVEDGAAAKAHIGARAGAVVVLIDTPAVSPRDAAAIARLAGDLRTAGVTETHVVLPATVAGPVAREAVKAFAPLEPAALLITHADETDHVGPLVDLAMAEGRPLSYLGGPGLAPVDPAALAARLLP